jgi:molybdate transport system substrate-binding protein
MKGEKRLKRFFILLLLAVLLVGCGNETDEDGTSSENTQPVELMILGAASLTDALKDIEATYESKFSDIELTMSYASSGKLQKQIEQGAPADLFLSAGVGKVDALGKKELIYPGFRTDLLKNEMVLVTNQSNDKISAFEDLKSSKLHKLSIGYPETVPAGKYAKQTLESMGIWENIKPKIVFGNDVRQVLTYVETGNVGAGIVYKTDAATSNNIKVLQSAPQNSHEPVVYPMAIIKQTEHLEKITRFYKWLQSDEAIEIFEEYGFSSAQ